MSVWILNLYISANMQASPESPTRQLVGVWTKNWPNVNWPWGVTWSPLKAVLGNFSFPSFAAFKAVIHKSWGGSGQLGGRAEEGRRLELFNSFLPQCIHYPHDTCECTTRSNVWMQMKTCSPNNRLILNTQVFWEREMSNQIQEHLVVLSTNAI